MEMHGEYRLGTYGQVAWVRAYSSTNREFMEMLRDRIKSSVAPLIKRPWICVSDVADWDLGGPEVMPPLIELVHWYENNNRSHSIVVTRPGGLQDVMLNKTTEGIQRHSELHMVHTVEDAIDKVRQLDPGFDAEAMKKEIYD